MTLRCGNTLRKKFDHSHLLLAQDLQERAADKWMDWVVLIYSTTLNR